MFCVYIVCILCVYASRIVYILCVFCVNCVYLCLFVCICVYSVCFVCILCVYCVYTRPELVCIYASRIGGMCIYASRISPPVNIVVQIRVPNELFIKVCVWGCTVCTHYLHTYTRPELGYMYIWVQIGVYIRVPNGNIGFLGGF